MKCIKEKRGITLIVLAVTIVVILILAGVTINVTLGENGILNKSKEAADRMNNLVKEDEAELNKLLNELDDTMDANWNGNIEIPGGNGEANTELEPPVEPDKPIGELIDNGTIKIGDYVAYTPTGAGSYTVDGTYSGTGSHQIINKENLNWRVLDKTEDGKVRLISANPTEATVKLQGANGYNNAVYLLDELCNTLYKGTNATAKSLKIEDIQDKMNLSYWDYHNYSGYGINFNPTYKQYPLIVAQEKGQTIDGINGTLGISEQSSIVQGIGTASSWEIKHTYWYNSMYSSNYINEKYYEIYHIAIINNYWLSSRAICVNGKIRNDYVINYVTQNGIGEYSPAFSDKGTLYGSSGGESTNTCSIRPVIILKSNTEVDTSVAGKDGTSPDKAWVIK